MGRKQDKLSETPVAESDRSDLKELNKREGGSLESDEYHEGRPSLRRGKMIPCPLCGVEYAIASNLQKHIDKDHMEGDDRSSNKRKSKEKSEVVRKKKKVDDDAASNVRDSHEDESPGPSATKTNKPTRRSDEFDNILEKSRTGNRE